MGSQIFKVMLNYLFSYFCVFHNNTYCSVFYNLKKIRHEFSLEIA